MVSSERSGEVDGNVGVSDALTRIDQRIDDLRSDFNERMGDLNERMGDLGSEVNGRIDDLRADVDAKLKLLMWAIGIGFATVLALLGALLARGG